MAYMYMYIIIEQTVNNCTLLGVCLSRPCISCNYIQIMYYSLKYITIATSRSILLPENSYSTCHYEASSDLICLHIDTLSRL